VKQLKVYVHVDSKSTYVGNGGFLILANLAVKLLEMGYETYMFDQWHMLEPADFKWLSLSRKIPISKEIEINNNTRIITSWLKTLPQNLRNAQVLRFLETSELLRNGHEAEREWLIKHGVKIANLHRHLKDLYESLGLRNIIDLDVWIREDVKRYPEIKKKENSVGIQYERRRILKFFYIYDQNRYGQFTSEKIIVCNGTYEQVIERMNKADFFVHFPRPSSQISLFKGETFGLPLFEAMACGCVCIARRHRGINFLENVFLVDNMKEAREVLQVLKSSNLKNMKEKIRSRSMKFIEENFRFDNKRKEAIQEWLS